MLLGLLYKLYFDSLYLLKYSLLKLLYADAGKGFFSVVYLIIYFATAAFAVAAQPFVRRSEYFLAVSFCYLA